MSRLRLVLVPLAALLALAGVASVAAAPPTPASGTFTYTSCIPNSVRTVAGNTIIDFTCTVAYTGTFSGVATLRGPLIIHADGSTNYQGTEAFVGTVAGRWGLSRSMMPLWEPPRPSGRPT